jgi:ammonia channel protein AmtB
MSLGIVVDVGARGGFIVFVVIVVVICVVFVVAGMVPGAGTVEGIVRRRIGCPVCLLRIRSIFVVVVIIFYFFTYMLSVVDRVRKFRQVLDTLRHSTFLFPSPGASVSVLLLPSNIPAGLSSGNSPY